MKHLIKNLIVIAISLASPALFAQEASPDELSDQFSVLEEDVGSLGISEMRNSASSKLNKMKTRLRDVNTLLKRVRREQEDVSKVNCINNRMATMKGLTKISENSFGQLQRAVQNRDREGVSHYYKLIAVAHKKLGDLVDEAQMCTGQFQKYGDNRQVEFEIDSKALEDQQTREEAIEQARQGADDSSFSTEAGLPELTPYQ